MTQNLALTAGFSMTYWYYSVEASFLDHPVLYTRVHVVAVKYSTWLWMSQQQKTQNDWRNSCGKSSFIFSYKMFHLASTVSQCTKARNKITVRHTRAAKNDNNSRSSKTNSTR